MAAKDSVAFFPARHPATAFSPSAGMKRVPNESPALTLFRHVYPRSAPGKEPKELFQTSVTGNLDNVIPQGMDSSALSSKHTINIVNLSSGRMMFGWLSLFSSTSL